MAKRCELTGTGVQSGHKVSHSNIKTKRRFLPNLHVISVNSSVIGKVFRLRVTAATLRSIDHNGGLDEFLLTANNNSLSEEALKIKRKIKKAMPTVKTEAKKA
jgi:large subunit ribosomal protein L28